MRNKILVILLLLCSVCLGQSVPDNTTFNLRDVTNLLGGGSLQGAVNSAASFPDSFWDSRYGSNYMSPKTLYGFRNYTITALPCGQNVLYLGGLPTNPRSYPISFGSTAGLVVCEYAGWKFNSGDPIPVGGLTWTIKQSGVTRDATAAFVSDGSMWYYNVNHHDPSQPLLPPLRFIYNPANGTSGTLSIAYQSYMLNESWYWQMHCPTSCSLGTAYSTPHFSCYSFYFPNLVAGANYSLYTERLTGNGGSVDINAWDAAGTMASPTSPILTGTPSIYPSTVMFNSNAATGLVFDLHPTSTAALDDYRITLTRVLTYPTMASTVGAYSITPTTAWSGGTISDDGGSAILSKGVCFGTSSNPLYSGPHTDNGTGTGYFDSYLTSLSSNTTYHYRSYAHNSVGEGYGPDYTFTTSPAVVAPTVSTTVVTSIGTTTATLGGNATDAGNGTIASKGVFYSNTTSNPNETNASFTADGSGIGSFASPITGLSPGQYYYYRAYAYNGLYGYGSINGFWTNCNPVVLSAGLVSPTAITSSGFTAGGNVTSLGGCDGATEGIVAAASPTIPTTANFNGISGSGLTGPFTASITGLSPGVLYNYRSYATNSSGTTYGTQGTVTTLANLPTVTTTTATNSYAYYSLGGNVTSDGGATTSKGVYYGTSTSPSSGLTGWSGVGSYSGNTPTLSSNTRYYYRAFATNSAGTSYGTELNFLTPSPPTVASTTAASSITQTTASTGGNVTSDGGQGLIARGVCYGTSSNPTTANSTVTTTNTTGIFTSSLTGLAAGTTYYVRAYASNYFGTTYATQISFTTQSAVALPTVTTATASASYTYFTLGGNVTSDGGATTSRGVYYGTTTSPTSGVAMGTGTGVFSGTTPSLVAATKYYYRAYASNSAGTNYGTELNLTTMNMPTAFSTTAATSITGTTATTGGNVTSDGGGGITARGVCYALSTVTTTPTTANSVSTVANTTGVLPSYLTGLTAGMTYYVRAYATNYWGTTYAPAINFTTAGGNITVTWSCSIVAGSGGMFQIQVNGGAPTVNQGTSGSGSFVVASGATVLAFTNAGSRGGCNVTMTGKSSVSCATQGCTSQITGNPTTNITCTGAN